MALTPLDIRSQSFTRRLRGFDADEVGAFLSILAEHYDDLQREVRHRETRIADLESKLVHYERIEEALQEALRTARESQRHALDTAARQAEQIRGEAALEARSVVQEAQHDRNRLRQETQAIAARRKEIVARLRGFLMSEMEMLAHFEGEDPIGFIQLRRDGDARFGTPAPFADALVSTRTSEPPPESAPPAPPPVEEEETPDETSATPHDAAADATLPGLRDLTESSPPSPEVPPPSEPADAPLPSGATAFATTTPDEAPPEATATYTAPLVPTNAASETPAAERSEAVPEAPTLPFAAAPHGDASVSMPPAYADDIPEAPENLPPFDLPAAAPAFADGPAPQGVEEVSFDSDRYDAAASDEADDLPFIDAATDDAREIVRPSWMDEVPADLLAAPLFAPEPAEAPIPATLPPTVAVPATAPPPPPSYGLPDPAPQPTVPSPLAERLARAAAAPEEAPVAMPASSPDPPAAHAARPRYVVTSFLGDATAAPSGPPEAESEEIARVRRLLDGLG